jgi:hypothetical protein
MQMQHEKKLPQHCKKNTPWQHELQSQHLKSTIATLKKNLLRHHGTSQDPPPDIPAPTRRLLPLVWVFAAAPELPRPMSPARSLLPSCVGLEAHPHPLQPHGAAGHGRYPEFLWQPVRVAYGGVGSCGRATAWTHRVHLHLLRAVLPQLSPRVRSPAARRSRARVASHRESVSKRQKCLVVIW